NPAYRPATERAPATGLFLTTLHRRLLHRYEPARSAGERRGPGEHADPLGELCTADRGRERPVGGHVRQRRLLRPELAVRGALDEAPGRRLRRQLPRCPCPQTAFEDDRPAVTSRLAPELGRRDRVTLDADASERDEVRVPVLRVLVVDQQP